MYECIKRADNKWFERNESHIRKQVPEVNIFITWGLPSLIEQKNCILHKQHAAETY